MQAKLVLFTLFFVILPFSLKAQSNKYQVVCAGFYNLENLFDTLNDPHTRDDEFTPTGKKHWTARRYQNKLDKLSLVISDLGTDYTPNGAAILGVCEIENKKVLEDLIRQPNLIKRGYNIVHENSPDRRGIDVALLYQPGIFQVMHYRYVELQLIQSGKKKTYRTRNQLVVCGEINHETLYVIVNHWPSRMGGVKRSEHKRILAAKTCRTQVDSLLALEENAKIIVIGDFNDDPDNQSMVKYLNAETDLSDLDEGEIYNTTGILFKNGEGTLAYKRKWNLFDQILVSQALLKKSNGKMCWYKSLIFSEPYLQHQKGRYKGIPLRTYSGKKYLGGYSDHLPVYMVLLLGKG